MEVVSVNIGAKEYIEWKGVQKATGIFKRPVAAGSIEVETNGVTGDYIAETKVHGGPEMACYIFSQEHYDYWKELYPDLDWHYGMFGENLTISGLNERTIHIGDQLQIGEVVLEIAQPRIPCYKLGARFGNQKLLKEFLIHGHCGAYTRVIKEGVVTNGQAVKHVEKQDVSPISMFDMFSLLTTNKDNEMLKSKALSHPKLAASYKKSISSSGN